MISSYALVFLCIGSVAFAQQPSIDSGLAYLHSSQNSTGSWGGTDSSFTDIIPTTTTVIETLRLLESSASSQQILGRSFLSAQALTETDYIARRVLALAGTTSLVASDQTTLLSIQNRPGGAGFASDNGWGGLTGYGSLVLDTSLALQALSAVHFSDSNVLGPAISYLLSSQNADGGWGFAKGEASQVYDTALVLLALNDFRASFNTSTSVVSGINFLLSHQNANGSFGSPNGTPFETALAFQAILRFVFDPAKRSAAANYLVSTQTANGSWGDDPYSTALALRALREVQTSVQPQNISIGLSRVVDSNREPRETYKAFETMAISVATDNPDPLLEIVVQNGTETILSTRIEGEEFLFDTLNLPPGTYTVIVRVLNPDTQIIIDERTLFFTIEGSVGIKNPALGVIPQFTHVGATEAVTVALSLTNRSNVPANLTIEHQIKSPSGSILNSGTTTLLLPVETISTGAVLDVFNHLFSESGNYPIQVKIFNGIDLLTILTGIISAAPDIRIDPSKTLTPQTITPDGEKRIRINIHLEGVEQNP